MKKIIAVIILLIAAAAGFAFALQGYPWKSKIEKEYGGIHTVPTEEIDAMTSRPDGWSTYRASGIKFYAPEGLKYDEANYCYYSDDNSLSITIAPDGSANSEYVDNFLAEMDITSKEMKHFCEKSDIDYPANLYDLFRIQTSLSEDNFNIHNYKAAHTFYKLMGDSSMGNSNIYFIKSSSYKGFIMHAAIGQSGFDAAVSASWLFENNGSFYHINVVSPDEKQNLEIARSLSPLEE